MPLPALLGTLLGGPIIQAASDMARDIMDRIWPKKVSEAEKIEDEQKRLAAQMALEGMIMERDAALTSYTKDIIVAEMNQGDNYTKRARPTVVYAGLAFICLTSIIFPMMMWVLAVIKKDILPPPVLALPTDFWWIWGGVCSVWMVGRSFEKRGINSGVINAITGNGNGK